MTSAFAFALATGEEFEQKADRKVNGWVVFGCAVFGSKYNDATDLYDRAAGCYGISKAWNKAAGVYLKLAACFLKLDSKHEAALAYADAANCYERISPKDAISCLNQAVDQFKEIGRFDMAAKYCKEIGRVYEVERDLENSIVYFKKAADLFPTSAEGCMHKVAQLYAQLEQYTSAIEIYEDLAKQSVKNNIFKDRVKGYLLNAGLCHLYQDDVVVAIYKTLYRYEAMDPTFSKTREHNLLADLAASIIEEDVKGFTDVVKELKINSLNGEDDWKITLLLRVKKNLIKATEDEDIFLT